MIRQPPRSTLFPCTTLFRSLSLCLSLSLSLCLSLSRELELSPVSGSVKGQGFSLRRAITSVNHQHQPGHSSCHTHTHSHVHIHTITGSGQTLVLLRPVVSFLWKSTAYAPDPGVRLSASSSLPHNSCQPPNIREHIPQVKFTHQVAQAHSEPKHRYKLLQVCVFSTQ